MPSELTSRLRVLIACAGAAGAGMLSCTLGACNTVEGAGEDIESAGEAIEDSADDD